MDQDNYITLIYKKLKKEISPTELESLDKWLVEDEQNAQLQQQLADNWQLSKTTLPPIKIDTKKDFQGFKQRMNAHNKTKSSPKQAIVRPFNNRRRLLSIAAAIAIPLLAAIWIFSPTSSPAISIAQTTVNETKMIELADGTKITLNENSSINYPTAFATNERQVQLNGEAFFEVHSDPNRPFEVQMDKASVKVLGTIFNVRSIASEKVIKVSVEEGKVEFSSTLIGKGVILTKGEEGKFDLNTNQITEAIVGHKNASAWKTKALTYKNVPLKTVIQDLAQHFKVKVTIKKEAMKDCPVTARFGAATPKGVLTYIVALYDMQLVTKDDQNYELVDGICL